MRIAFVGLGAMGLPIARRLAAVPGTELHLYDAAPTRLALAEGLGRIDASVGAAIRDAELIITVLPADRHVRSVADEIAAAGGPGQLLIDLSTIAPDTMEQVADRLAEKGIGAVSATMTRGTAAAERGELALFIGTRDGPLPAHARTALSVTATNLIEVQGLAGAKALKIANNMALGCVDLAIGEALVLAHAYGAPPNRVTEALASGGADSWALHNQVERHVLTGRLGPGYFGTRYMAKDMALHLDLAARVGAPAFMAAVATAAYRGLIAGGMGDDYHPVVVRWLERISYAGHILESTGGTPGVPDDEVLGTIVAGVAGMQAVITSEALEALAACGVAPEEAARCLRDASAGNAQLAVVARRLGDGDPPIDEAVIAGLDGMLALSATAEVPGLMAEVARQAARGSLPPR